MEENYIVSARKYRPSTFSSVVGQKALTGTLKNAISTGRLAHAYLFCGSRGVGKTSCARIFAKTINCANPTPDGNPCNECPSCKAFNENRSLNIIELDAASNNSVDDIRNLVDQVQIPPTDGRYRVFIVDEVHMLSSAAFNAFLKTLEEPPSYVIFILATTEKHKIIPTILSRCQIYDFNRITISDIVDHLSYVAAQEGISAERAALSIIARKADGAMRDALSIFDQVAASSRGNITYQSTIDNLNVLDERYYARLLDAFRESNVGDALLTYKEIRDRGFDSHFFINGLADYLRNLMVSRNPQTQALLDADDETKALMARQASQLPPEFYYAAMSLCNDADMAYRQASSKTFLVELLLIKLCQLQSPSPTFSGNGEGPALKKIEPTQTASAPQAAPVQPATPAATATTTVQQPATTTQPARPVTTPTSRTAPRRTALTAGMKHISLRDAFTEKPEQQTTVETQTQPHDRNDFTDDAFFACWEDYMARHPKAHLLCNTMRASRPTRQQQADGHADNFLMRVENQAQVDVMTEEMPSILDHLRKNLHNDFIAISLQINEGAAAPTAWSDRELLAHIVETTPYAAKFIRDFKLTIS